MKEFFMSTDRLSSGLNQLNSTADSVGSVADLVGNDKLASQIAKAQKTMSQATQVVGIAKEVIHRVQQIGLATTPSTVWTSSDNKPNAESLSPLDLLTALFKRPPSGLQFTLTAGDLSPLTFSVIRFQFTSHYSDLYCLDVMLSSANPAVDPAAILDNRAVLSVWQDGILQQTLSGMVADFEQGDSGFRNTHYRLKIYPDLWRTTLRHNARIFQQKDIQTIISTLLEENKVADYAFVLRHPHAEREFCVQYRETDFDFLQRLTAEEGIFYYFEQDNGQHRLIFTDDAATLGTSVALPYNVNRNAQLQEKSITSFNRSEKVRPSQVQLKDYTFRKPNWTAQFDATAKDAEHQRSGYEHYDYPGRFKDGRGQQYTRYRLDGLRQDAHLGWGESNSPNLQVGKLFSLQRHSNESLNTLWQPVSIIYQGKQPQAAEVEAGEKGTTLTARFEFIPSGQTWRPMQRTKPRVEGPQMAIVVGPKGEEIYTDNFGRIRLQFLWDREGKSDDHSSCWIRVTQPWAGKGWGMMAIPRVGHEVVVNFLDGDPDQPIVTGRTYHANNMSPAALPANKTQMHLMSQTYKGNGYNGVLMEDSPGGQRLDFQAQKDMTTDVLNDKTTVVNNEHSESVSKAQNITVQGNRNKTVQQNELVLLASSSINEVGIKRTLTSEKQLVVSSQGGSISLSTNGASITLTHEGSVVISGSGEVTINGQESVYVNNGAVSDAAGNPIAKDAPPPEAVAAANAALAQEWQAQSKQIEQLRAEGKHDLADKLDRERRALQAARLAQAAYSPIGSHPPAGWKEISMDQKELAKYGLSAEDFPPDTDFRARVFAPDPAVFGNDMKPTISFKGTTSLEDWKNNLKQGLGLESDYYTRAVKIGEKIKKAGTSNAIEIVGHSLGGGLASAASMASGAKATTFNAAGVRDITVKRITEIESSQIEAYYIKKELLTRVQELEPKTLPDVVKRINPTTRMPYALADAADALGALAPNARYTERYQLPIQTKDNWIPFDIGNSLDDHGMDKVINALESQFTDTIKLISP